MTHCCCSCQNKESCLQKVPIFKYLNPEERQKILDTSITKTFLKGEIITFEHSTNLWVVNIGKVKLSKISHEGKEQVIRVLYPGDFLGELTLFTKTDADTTATALEDTRICIINGYDLKKIIKSNPEIAFKFLEVFSERIKAAESMIEQIGIHDVDCRLAKSLLHEANNAKKNFLFTLPFSKTDWASLLGTTRETLSRKLSSYQKNGWIKLTGQRTIQIMDIESLKEIADK